MKDFEAIPEVFVTALPLTLDIGGSPGVLLLLICPEFNLQSWLLVLVMSICFPHSLQVVLLG
jgi:hypothetical protein